MPTPSRTNGPTNAMWRKVRTLYTMQEVADHLGCHVSTVYRMQRSFFSSKQRAIFRLAGYHAAFYPQRKAKHPSP